MSTKRVSSTVTIKQALQLLARIEVDADTRAHQFDCHIESKPGLNVYSTKFELHDPEMGGQPIKATVHILKRRFHGEAMMVVSMPGGKGGIVQARGDLLYPLIAI